MITAEVSESLIYIRKHLRELEETLNSVKPNMDRALELATMIRVNAGIIRASCIRETT